MKSNNICALCTAGLVALPFSLLAQTADLNWSAIVGGGGTSTAGRYSLAGTIGQTALPRVHSSNYTIDSGFMSIVAAIQEPGAPFLCVRFTQTNSVVVSWPITWPGYFLLETADLSSGNWQAVTTQPKVVVTGENTTEKQVVAMMPLGTRFYRLKRP